MTGQPRESQVIKRHWAKTVYKRGRRTNEKEKEQKGKKKETKRNETKVENGASSIPFVTSRVKRNARKTYRNGREKEFVQAILQPPVLLPSFGHKCSSRFLLLSRLLYNEIQSLLLLLLYSTRQRKNFILGANRTTSRWL